MAGLLYSKNGNIFDQVGVNKSTVSGIFTKNLDQILWAQINGKYWASGISVVAHMKNLKSTITLIQDL